MTEPPPDFAHLRYGSLCPQKYARAVDGHDPLPVRQGGFFHQAANATDAGVVDQHVKPAEARGGDGDGFLPIGLAGHVEVNEDTGAAHLVNLRLYPAAIVVQDVADGDLGAFLGKQPRLGGAHAARAATDECYLAVESAHCEPPEGKRLAVCVRRPAQPCSNATRVAS